jgi:hypothetical protein
MSKSIPFAFCPRPLIFYLFTFLPFYLFTLLPFYLFTFFESTPNHNTKKSLGNPLFKGVLRWLPVSKHLTKHLTKQVTIFTCSEITVPSGSAAWISLCQACLSQLQAVPPLGLTCK